MGFIPKGACWYLADVVQEHRIDGESQNVVHINTHLIEAGTPEEAHAKALTIGREGEHEYSNVVGARVQVLFRGLRELNVIHEPLEDGAEIMYSERIGVPEAELRAWIKPKERLGVFAAIEPRLDGPILMPGLVKDLIEGLPETDLEDDQSGEIEISGDNQLPK
jgi:uncharacterized protein DUF4288